MQHLIPMTRTEMGTTTVPTVNARDLHQFLEVQTEFKNWIIRRIEEYGFEDGKDFREFFSESTGGRPAKEYALSDLCRSNLTGKSKSSGGHNRKNYLCLILPNGRIKKHGEDHRHLDGGQRHGR